MISTRVGAAALRQGKFAPKNAFFTAHVARTALASQIPAIQTRLVATQKLTPSDANSILVAQRVKRPVSPNLAIYDYSHTWFGHSAWQRITGAGYSGALYAFACAYLAAPLVGWHLESASIAAAFGALPFAIKGGVKFLFAWPFVYHAVNGVRHLLWDLAFGFTTKKITSTGWAIWGSSLVASLYMAFGL